MMPWQVYVASADVEEWIGNLSDTQQEDLQAAIEVLSEDGPTLGRPLVDRVHQSRHQKMKELRPPSQGRTVLRVLFAFDSQRRAALLVGGDKAEGSAWNDWYDEWVPVADDRLDELERDDGGAGKKKRRRKRGGR